MHINQGLRRYNAVLFIPLYNCFYIILSSTLGAITYKEFSSYTLAQWICFPLGIMMTVVGIFIMSLKDPTEESDMKVTPLPSASPSKAESSGVLVGS
jgi:hypothetical protein